MSRCAALSLAIVLGLISAFSLAAIDPDRDFSGKWVLDPQSKIPAALPQPPDRILAIAQQENKLACSAVSPAGDPSAWSFSTGGDESKYQLGAEQRSVSAKWEGSALLVNTVVSGPGAYSIMDRWTLSKDGSALTIHRQVSDSHGQAEADLTYRREGQTTAQAQPAAPALSALSTRPGPAAPDEIVVPAGTRVLLELAQSVSTKSAKAGDHLFLQTAMPVAAGGRMVIPRGSSVEGTITAVQKPKGTKSSAQLSIRFDTLTLPSGLARDLRSRPDAADAKDTKVDDREGEIARSGNGSTDTKIYQRTVTGATLGTLTGAATGAGAARVGMIGAVGGLGSVLMSRGQDVVLPKGSNVEMVLDRDLRFKPEELRPY